MTLSAPSSNVAAVSTAPAKRTVEIVEPFPPHAVPRIWSWTQEFRNRVADDWSPSTLDDFVGDWESKSAAGRRTWAVLRDGELGGMVNSMRLSPVDRKSVV